MTKDAFRRFFAWAMGFCLVFWVWMVAVIMAWPWDKNVQWTPDDRLVALCTAEKTACSVRYADLESAKTSGKISGLQPPADQVDTGDVQEADAWLHWEKAKDKPWQWEVKRSAWHFETIWRYRFENDGKPVLLQRRTINGDVIWYALPAAFLMILGLFLRSLRK